MVSPLSAFDEYGVNAPPGTLRLANKTSFIGDLQKALANRAIARANGIKVTENRGDIRPVAITFRSAEAIINGQLSFERSEKYDQEIMAGDGDTPTLWCTSRPGGAGQAWLMDAYRCADPAAHGIGVGVRLHDGGVVIGTAGLFFKVAYGLPDDVVQTASTVNTAETRAAARRAAADHAAAATRQSHPAPALAPTQGFNPITNLNKFGGDASVGLVIEYRNKEGDWVRGTLITVSDLITKAAQGRATRKAVAASYAVTFTLHSSGEQISTNLDPLLFFQTKPDPAQHRSWILFSPIITADTPTAANGVDTNSTTADGDDDEADSDNEDDEAADAADDVAELMEDADDEEPAASITVDDSSDTYGGSGVGENGEVVKLLGLSRVLRDACPGQGVQALAEAWKHFLCVMVACWFKSVQVMHRQLHDTQKKCRAYHTNKVDSCLTPIVLRKGAQPPTVRTGGKAQAVLKGLKCRDLLWAGIHHPYSDEADAVPYLSYCWPRFNWQDFETFDLMTRPTKTIKSTNNNASSDVIKLLLVASTINRIPDSSTLFIPVTNTEMAMVKSRISADLVCPDETATAVGFPQPDLDVAARLPKSLVDLLGGSAILSCPISRVENLVKATDTRRTSNDETNGYSPSAVNNLNTKCSHATGAVSFHVLDIMPRKYLKKLRKYCATFVQDIRNMQAKYDAEAQEFAKKEQDGRLPMSLQAPALYRDMWATINAGVWCPIRNAITAHLQERNLEWEAFLKPCIERLIGNKGKTTNNDGTHLITELGEALAKDLIADGFNAYDAAALETYVSMKWIARVSERGQSFFDNKASLVYCSRTQAGIEYKQVINKPLEKKQVSCHSGANAANNGALHVTICAPKELHEAIIVILFILRRLRAIMFNEEPADVLIGLPGNGSAQVNSRCYTDFINEIGRLHLAIDRYGVFSMRNATATAICTTARIQEAQGQHQLAATTRARGARMLDTSLARFETAYDQSASRDLSMLPSADMTYIVMQEFSMSIAQGTRAPTAVTQGVVGHGHIGEAGMSVNTVVQQQQAWQMQQMQQYFSQIQAAEAARTEALVNAWQRQHTAQWQQWQEWQMQQYMTVQYMFDRMQAAEASRTQALMSFQENLVNRLLGPQPRVAGAAGDAVGIDEANVNVGGKRRAVSTPITPQAKRGTVAYPGYPYMPMLSHNTQNTGNVMLTGGAGTMPSAQP
ncbi:hypothetical protein JKP88DRAFT_242403 [Tribonema minus]|uniref:Uncharacterized protein n=1 Tax=Tribonema minus TaxID=303371 RepID=A0A835YJE7_9STRA|nr:hypothetical protein JKP88DRAFT_242403 [Tribonema minus]